MNELLEILAVAKRLHQAGEPFVVATVVKIGGSSYRRPGARMLVDATGRTWGTISGGCLEGEVAQQALAVLDKGEARLLPFTLGEDDLVLGFGTGCDGVVHVFIEPVTADSRINVLDLFTQCFETRRQGVLATVIEATGTFRADLGGHLLVEASGSLSGGLTDPQLHREVLLDARALLDLEQKDGRPHLWQTRTIEHEAGSAEILAEIIRPPIRLLVFGEGHDVGAIVRLAKPMGWEVVVVGRKPAEVLLSRFPEADDHIFLMHPESVLERVTPDPHTAAVVMNHTYVRDRELMGALLGSAIPYVGMLGPSERTTRMIGELAGEGSAIASDKRARLFGPVGLDIGTETPEEIALAAIAEIQAVLNGRSGLNLRDRTGPIHSGRAEIG